MGITRTSFEIRDEDFYTIKKDELNKFYSDITEKAINIHKASKRIKGYKENPIIRFKGIFSFHPYYEERPWMLHQRQISLCCKDTDLNYEKKFTSDQYFRTYKSYNPEAKRDPRTNFDYLDIVPKIEVQVLVTVTQDWKKRDICEVNELTIEFKTGDFWKFSTLLRKYAKKINYGLNSHLEIEYYLKKYHPAFREEDNDHVFYKDSYITGEKVYIYDDQNENSECLPASFLNTIELEKDIESLVRGMISIHNVKELRT